MQFFELNSRLRPGLKVELSPMPQVSVGIDAQRRLVIPLGRSIRQFIVGDDADQEGFFLLRHGELKDTTQGLVLVHQDIQDAERDDRALVLVSFIADRDEGEAIHFGPLGTYRPKVLHERVIVFSPGDGIAIRYVSRIAPRVLRLRWDGRQRWMAVDQDGPARFRQRNQSEGFVAAAQ